MVRNYKRKKESNIDEVAMTTAIADVLKRKCSIRGTATKYNLNHNTLFKRVKLAKELNEVIHSEESGNDSDDENIKSRRCLDKTKYKHRQIFSDSEELQLNKYLLRSSQINFGLTYIQTRQLAYEYAKKLGKSYPASWDVNKISGKDWMYNFMKRNSNLSLRKPENTSLARASAFNETNVSEFFKNYVQVLEKFKFTPSKIFNIDETGITTVLQAPKIIAEKSKRQVGQIVSGERGELVTFCGIINAIGNSLPPVFIFPRVRYKEQFLLGSPSGSLGLASKSGWMTDELFPEVLEHIKTHSNCSKEKKILLLMDNHKTHCSLSAIDFARNNGIILLSFPPHCSHKLQPCDIGVFGPFKNALKVAFNNFMAAHPGKLITIYDIPHLSKIAYEKSFTPSNILSSFEKPGIWPLNQLAFNKEDFAATYVADRPMNVAVENQETDVAQNCEVQLPSTSNGIFVPTAAQNCEVQLPSTSNEIFIPTPQQIKPFPKAPARKKISKGREKGKSRI